MRFDEVTSSVIVTVAPLPVSESAMVLPSDLFALNSSLALVSLPPEIVYFPADRVILLFNALEKLAVDVPLTVMLPSVFTEIVNPFTVSLVSWFSSKFLPVVPPCVVFPCKVNPTSGSSALSVTAIIDPLRLSVGSNVSDTVVIIELAFCSIAEFISTVVE